MFGVRAETICARYWHDHELEPAMRARTAVLSPHLFSTMYVARVTHYMLT
jgi:hypothetical protein